jgi:division protein CdvB (Snf7/Vps24/ESCRT-III family)
MTGFEKNWKNVGKTTASDRLKESLRPQGPLKPRLDSATNKLQLQTSKLDTLIAKLNERDATLFRRVVEAMQRHDTDTARVLSNELAEVRKVSRTINQAKMAIEQVQLRLGTINDLGDAMVMLGPAMASIKGLRTGLGRFAPEADVEFGNMQNLLNGIMMESVQGSGANIDFNTVSGGDIDHIMMEASAVAEQKVTDKFPSVPASSGYNVSEGHEQ